MNLKFLLIQLNEINFDLVDKYLLSSKKNKFINLKILRETFNSFETYSEDKYKNLEPWIQWVSVNLGKEFNKHNIFRLGDIVNYPEEKQIFEIIEKRGFKVGAVSPMNTENRLKEPAYFISDPWTNTRSDNSKFSKKISLMLKQTVNDNAIRGISINSFITILEVIFKTFQFKKTSILFKLIFSSIFKPWKKSLILDYLIHMIHIYLLKKKIPNFSSIFFNAGAHIQHHYLYSSKYINDFPKNPDWYVSSFSDPIEDMLEIYDIIIGDYLKLYKNGFNLCISTGLRQVPYNKKKFYYRLKDHSSFLKKIGIKFLKVSPRMSRDFEIIFENNSDLINSKQILENIKNIKDNIKIFSEIEERDKSLFVTLTYSNEIKKDDNIIINNYINLNFFNEVAFVAIKNGMHDTKGYVFCSPNSSFKIPQQSVHVSTLHDMILKHF